MHLKDLCLSSAKQKQMIAFHCHSLICHFLKRKEPLHILSDWTREHEILWTQHIMLCIITQVSYIIKETCLYHSRIYKIRSIGTKQNDRTQVAFIAISYNAKPVTWKYCPLLLLRWFTLLEIRTKHSREKEYSREKHRNMQQCGSQTIIYPTAHSTYFYTELLL